MDYIGIVLILCVEESGQFSKYLFLAGILILNDFLDDGMLPKNCMLVTICATFLSYITSGTAPSG
jgi:hypothetical protein